MAMGPKTRRFLLAQQNPTAAVLESLDQMERMIKGEAKDESQRVVSAMEKKAYARIQQLAGIVEIGLRQLIKNADDEIKKQVKEKIDTTPQIKGEPGYTPVKGKDYFDGNPGSPGHTPQPGVDYPTIATMESFVGGMLTAFYDELRNKGLTAEQMRKEMQKMFDDIPGEKIARSLEKLHNSNRLSYTALKDRPSEQVGTAHHTLHRGGGSAGKQTYEYDLSSLCDGSTKVFTIPTNTRIVLVQGTDAPMGIYRKTVDWTGTGTTSLTLTAAVAAPSRGANLNILYVV